jgi:glyoxylate reductase
MTRPHRVFVTRKLPGSALEKLAARTRCELWSAEGQPAPQELAARLRDCQGLLCLLTDRIDAVLLEACPRLRVISSCSVGVDHIDLEAATARGIPVGNTPGVLVETTAELAFGLMLAAARRIAEADRFVRAGRWTPDRRWEPEMLLGLDLHGATLGVIGLGQIGQAMARRAHAFGMRVLGWTRSGRQVDGVETTDFHRVLSQVDFLSIHVAYTPETRGLLGPRALAQVKPGAVLVNTARGGIVDEVALAEALRDGRLAAAALDVFEREPLDRESPLLEIQNIVLAPHIGSASIATRSRMAELAVDNLLAGLDGRPLPHCANPEAQPGEAVC